MTVTVCLFIVVACLFVALLLVLCVFYTNKQYSIDRELRKQYNCKSGQDEKMAESSATVNTTATDGPVFIDVQSSTDQSDQFPVISILSNVATDNVKEEQPASPSDPYTNFQQRRIRCPECSRFTAETEEKMLRHIRKVHRGENPFQCYMCDYSTYNKPLFEEHVRIHQGIKPFKCNHCPYRSVSKKNTKKHELIHRPDNPLRCQLCEFIARNPRGLNSHHKLTHGITKKLNYEETLQCSVCNEVFIGSNSYSNHMKSRKKCHICHGAFCFKLYKRHMKEAHEMEYTLKKGLKSVRDKKELFRCGVCKWSSSVKPRILLHLIHHPKQEVDESVVDVSVLRRYGIKIGA